MSLESVPRFTGKTRITGKTAEIPERPKDNRELDRWLLINGYLKSIFCLSFDIDLYTYLYAVSTIHILVCPPILIIYIDWVVSLVC